jgi:ArsR family metal-binding transcriptional regulator
MWVITVYSKKNITMFEFHTEKEAIEALEKIEDCKILSEVVYFNDPSLGIIAL